MENELNAPGGPPQLHDKQSKAKVANAKSGVQHSLNGVASQMNQALPAVVLALSGYTVYVYCYVYSWKEVVAFHSRSKGIAFIAVFSVLSALVVVTWLQILLVGPGRVAPIPQMEFAEHPARPMQGPQDSVQAAFDALPNVFECTPLGYAPWCSTCQSVKPSRVHHSAELGRCVPKMDHLCNWVGSIIGMCNYKAFIQFVFYFMVLLLFVIITLSVYAQSYYRRDDTNSAHLSIVYGLAGLWVCMLAGFFGVHVRYILLNISTIEHLKHNSGDFPIFNFKDSNGMRVVSRLRRNDPWPYDVGKYENWKQVMGPTPFHWLLPLPVNSQIPSYVLKTGSYSSDFNPKLLAILDHRYLSGEEGYLAYPNLQTVPIDANANAGANSIIGDHSSTPAPLV